MKSEVTQLQLDGQSNSPLQRRVHTFPEQNFDWQDDEHAAPRSLNVLPKQRVEVEGVPLGEPIMQTPPLLVDWQVQCCGQSFAVLQPIVHTNDGETPKQRPDWQSLLAEQPLPRSLYGHALWLPPPPPLPLPPPVLPQVLGPALLPPWKPPEDNPVQHVLKPAHAPGQACAPSWQRLFTHRRELTGGPLRHSQYQ